MNSVTHPLRADFHHGLLRVVAEPRITAVVTAIAMPFRYGFAADDWSAQKWAAIALSESAAPIDASNEASELRL
jgi:hypothetical protein